jgi:hypothetical protein
MFKGNHVFFKPTSYPARRLEQMSTQLTLTPATYTPIFPFCHLSVTAMRSRLIVYLEMCIV